MLTRKPNLWNTYQHYGKLARLGGWIGRWAFNFFRGLMNKEKLDEYDRHFR